jgi:hypothetical protein
VLVQPFTNDADHDLVTDQPTVVHHQLCHPAQLGALALSSPQHVTGGDVGYDKVPRQANTLGTFARALAAEQDEPGARDHAI